MLVTTFTWVSRTIKTPMPRKITQLLESNGPPKRKQSNLRPCTKKSSHKLSRKTIWNVRKSHNQQRCFKKFEFSKSFSRERNQMSLRFKKNWAFSQVLKRSKILTKETSPEVTENKEKRSKSRNRKYLRNVLGLLHYRRKKEKLIFWRKRFVQLDFFGKVSWLKKWNLYLRTKLS